MIPIPFTEMISKPSLEGVGESFAKNPSWCHVRKHSLEPSSVRDDTVLGSVPNFCRRIALPLSIQRVCRRGTILLDIPGFRP